MGGHGGFVHSRRTYGRRDRALPTSPADGDCDPMGPRSTTRPLKPRGRPCAVAALLLFAASGRLDAASFIRGDVDASGSLDVTDPILALGFLSLGDQRAGDCLDAAGFDDAGILDITDGIASPASSGT